MTYCNPHFYAAFDTGAAVVTVDGQVIQPADYVGEVLNRREDLQGPLPLHRIVEVCRENGAWADLYLEGDWRGIVYPNGKIRWTEERLKAAMEWRGTDGHEVG